jgi:hypothetical protein
MSNTKKLPEDRFVIRPEVVDPSDEVAMNQLAGDVAGWVVAHRKRVQAKTSVDLEELSDAQRAKAAAETEQTRHAAPEDPSAAMVKRNWPRERGGKESR